MTVEYRRAVPDDADQIVELRALMIDEVTGRASSPDEEWWQAAVAWMRRELAGEDVVAYVADDDGRVLAIAIGIRQKRPPGPRSPGGWGGDVSSVSTRPEARRAGHARAVVERVLAWFDERGIRPVDLTSTAAAEHLYLSLGFHEHPEAFLRRTGPARSED
jgi:GNAT superfamily N-acetyltransferase